MSRLLTVVMVAVVGTAFAVALPAGNSAGNPPADGAPSSPSAAPAPAAKPNPYAVPLDGTSASAKPANPSSAIPAPGAAKAPAPTGKSAPPPATGPTPAPSAKSAPKATPKMRPPSRREDAPLDVVFAPDPAGDIARTDDPPPDPNAEPHRSPTDLAVTPDGRWGLTPNHTAGTASVVDLDAGKVVAELPVGSRPFGAAVAVLPPAAVKDGNDAKSSARFRGVVTGTWSGTLDVVEWGPDGKAVKTAALRVGSEPRGVAMTADGARAVVALTTSDAVAEVDLAAGKLLRTLPVGGRPWHVSLSPDGKTFAVAHSRTNDVWFLDAGTLEVARKVRTTGDNIRRPAWSADSQWVYVAHIFTRGFPTTEGQIGRGWVIANHLARVPATGKGGRQAIALDVNGKAVGDADGTALSPDGKWIAVAAGGTHELLILKTEGIPWIEFGGPEDFIDPALLKNDRFRRVPLGGRPLAVSFLPDSRRAVVADYFGNCLHVVDVPAARVLSSITLVADASRAPVPDAVRRGEMLFTDAVLSHHQWYSCNSCHFWGHTTGLNFDTLNDRRFGNAKRTPTLRGAGDTGPWTWHGWQEDLVEACGRSVAESMRGKPVTRRQAEDMAAYIRSLDFPPNPNRGPDGKFTEAALRGRAVFRSEKAACNKCHFGDGLSSGLTYDVKTGESGDAIRGFNPPGLLGLYDRFPYLHDGRAKDLRSLLTRHHTPEKAGAKGGLTDAETDDLIAYLMQL